MTDSEKYRFIKGFSAVQVSAADTNQKNGFTAEDELIDEFQQWLTNRGADRFRGLPQAFRNARVGLKLMLMVGEIGEALEAVRKSLGPDAHCPEFTCEEVELAYLVLRLMNYAQDRNLRLAEAIIAKNQYNRNRPDHSKEARASEHGKKF